MSKMMTALYSPQYDFPVISLKPRLTYLIATVPRSGSTHLCLSLWRTGALGAPMEYLNQVSSGGLYQRVLKTGEDNYWVGVQRIRQSPNGVFGYKAFVQCFTKLGEVAPDLLSQVYSDKVIYLTRGDKVQQAISYARAVHSRKWFSDAPQRSDEPVSMAQVDEAMHWIKRQEWGWRQLFKMTNTMPLSILYEDLLQNSPAVIEKIIKYLGVEEHQSRIVDLPSLEIQRDTTSFELADRYRNREASRDTA